MFSPGTPFADRYRIDAEVGRGTFGVVYRAFDFVESRNVALKVLNPEANADEKLKHRLRREARLTSEMHNPHCVTVYDVAESAEGRAYIVMELLEGHELRAELTGGAVFPQQRVVAIGRQILDGVGAAHRLGVVHRDLKPNNVYLCRTPDGSDAVKVLDFGIAKVTGNPDGTGLSESARLTTHGSVLGTPVYMSPEQSRGEVPTPASDLYSIGVMLYEMLAGRPPFDDPNPVRVMMMHNAEELPPLPPTVASTPLGLAVRRALEKNPERRFCTAAEFSAALTTAPAAVSEPAKAAPAKDSTPLPASRSTLSPATTPTDVYQPVSWPEAPPRRPLWPIVLTVAAVVVAIAAALAGAFWPRS